VPWPVKTKEFFLDQRCVRLNYVSWNAENHLVSFIFVKTRFFFEVRISAEAMLKLKAEKKIFSII